MFSLSTDGYANSYKSEAEFHSAVTDYLILLNEHGEKAVADSLPTWLTETSAMGCGDDITMMVAYFTPDALEESEGTPDE